MSELREYLPPEALLALPDRARQALLQALAAELARDPDAPDDLPEAERDLGHAYVLADLLRSKLIWHKQAGTWMEYAGGVWTPIHEGRAVYLAAEALRKEYARQLAVEADKARVQALAKKVSDSATAARVRGALIFLSGMPGFYASAEAFDADPWLLNLKNGTLDLRTMELRPHAPADLLTKQAPIAYDPKADCPRWRAHIELCLPRPNVRRQVARDLGLALVGADLDELLPIWWGTGRNGKTTTVRVLQELMGPYACQAAKDLLVVSKYERHATDYADLAGRRLVFSQETDEGKRLNEALVKWLTGGDRVKARFVHQNNFEFLKTFTIFLVTNHKPIIRGTDTGTWRRVRLIPWTVEIPADKRRPQEQVVAELVAEGPGILNWLLDGFLDWYASPNWLAPEVAAATSAYKAEQDVLGAFLGESCELGERYSVPVGELYGAYLEWCARAGEEPVSKTTFGRIMRQRGFVQVNPTGTERRWQGLRLKRTAI